MSKHSLSLLILVNSRVDVKTLAVPLNSGEIQGGCQNIRCPFLILGNSRVDIKTFAVPFNSEEFQGGYQNIHFPFPFSVFVWKFQGGY